ncbi:hypothetical protein CPLU01_02167 [Colletotrichum plurivorum]|uniref:Uncharacterized protein n=1 Tax=Colletotrichum plurivorum TaxID=2175906 RepID=A0A8H6KWD3_9PEZI|nr:hypothetical protein CPLU01_02167 [Colletotrichum plurivorum]
MLELHLPRLKSPSGADPAVGSGVGHFRAQESRRGRTDVLPFTPTQTSLLTQHVARSTQHAARSTQHTGRFFASRQSQSNISGTGNLPCLQTSLFAQQRGTKRRGRTDARPIPNASPVLARASIYAFAAFVLNAPPRIWLVVASPVEFGSDAEHPQPSSVRRVGTGPKANCTGLRRRKP